MMKKLRGVSALALILAGCSQAENVTDKVSENVKETASAAVSETTRTAGYSKAVSYTHLTLPTIYSV